jgi:predicted nucleotidyltransferase
MTGRKSRSEILQNELARILARIDKAGIRKIILFGSLPSGNVGPASDIDLIIIRDTQERFLDRIETVYREIEPNVAVDILVYTPQEIEEMSRWSSFIRRALKEGRVLYEA